MLDDRDWAPFVHARPDWLTAGTVHLLVLAASVVAIEIVPLRLTRGEAGGERGYTAEDLGGHRWTFSQSIADVAPESWGGTTAA